VATSAYTFHTSRQGFLTGVLGLSGLRLDSLFKDESGEGWFVGVFFADMGAIVFDYY
jgi:hypothetical protein